MAMKSFGVMKDRNTQTNNNNHNDHHHYVVDRQLTLIHESRASWRVPFCPVARNFNCTPIRYSLSLSLEWDLHTQLRKRKG
jgi:hypothetical protein